MKNISFSLTTAAFLSREKDVTRRLRWHGLRPGMKLMACEKCMGLKPGESVRRLGPIEIVSVRRESLRSMSEDADYGRAEAAREGFPGMSGGQFVDMFCREMRCDPATVVTRIEFRHIEPKS